MQTYDLHPDELWAIRASDEGHLTWQMVAIVRAIVRLGDPLELEDGNPAYVVEQGEEAIGDFCRLSKSTIQRAFDALEESFGFRFRIWRKDSSKTRQLPNAYLIDELHARVIARRAQIKLPFEASEAPPPGVERASGRRTPIRAGAG